MINLSADEWEFYQKFYTETGPVLPPEGNGWEIVNIAGIALALSNEAKKTPTGFSGLASGKGNPTDED